MPAQDTMLFGPVPAGAPSITGTIARGDYDSSNAFKISYTEGLPASGEGVSVALRHSS